MVLNINSKFKDPEHQIANNILQEYCNLSFIEMQGFIASVLCEPRFVSHHEWTTMLGIHDISLDCKKKKHHVAITLSNAVACFMDIKEKLELNTYDPIIELKKLAILNDDSDLRKAVRFWSCGFISGVDLGMLSWIDDTENQELLYPIAVLATSDSYLREELKKSKVNKTVKMARTEAVQSLSETVNSIYQFWMADINFSSETSTNRDDVNTYNKSCICGSGNKYKDCCLVMH